MLTLSEKLFLLTLDDLKGRTLASAKDSLRFGLVNTALMELHLQDRIQNNETRIVVKQSDPPGGELLNDILAEIAEVKKSYRWKTWVLKLGRKKLIKQTAQGLVENNIIEIKDKRYHWVVSDSTPEPALCSPKYEVKSRLRQVILAGEPPSVEDIALLVLLRANGLFKLIFTTDEREAAKARLDELMTRADLDPALQQTLVTMESEAQKALKEALR